MVIKDIFVIVKESLLSVRYEGNDQDEFARLFEQWQDVEYLEEFFESNKSDLQSGFFGEISIEDAVFTTIDDAEAFESYIKQVAEEGKEDPDNTLHDWVFTPLHKNDISISRLESKAYGGDWDEKSWLRIYAIKIANNLYVVSGGAIKLTRAMKDRPHTTLELTKLKIVSQYLKEQGIESADDYGYIDLKNDD